MSNATHSPHAKSGKNLVLLGLGVIAILVISCFIVPFVLLRHVDTWFGSFLYWSVATLVVIVISALISLRWKD